MGVIILNYIIRIFKQFGIVCCIFTLFWIIVPIVAKRPIKNDKSIKTKIILLIMLIIMNILLNMIKF